MFPDVLGSSQVPHHVLCLVWPWIIICLRCFLCLGSLGDFSLGDFERFLQRCKFHSSGVSEQTFMSRECCNEANFWLQFQLVISLFQVKLGEEF